MLHHGDIRIFILLSLVHSTGSGRCSAMTDDWQAHEQKILCRVEC